MQFAQSLDAIQHGKALFWKATWGADYPDPENFLNILYGGNVPEDLSTGSYINTMRYQNPKFDSIFNLALREIDKTKRYELFRQADQIQVDAAAIMPILYEERTRLLHPYVENFPLNATDWRDLSRVYFNEKYKQ